MNSHTPSLADLEARLGKLERQNRRLKRLGLFCLLIAGSGFLLAQAPRKPPRAAPGAAAPAARHVSAASRNVLEPRPAAFCLRPRMDPFSPVAAEGV